jgi:hypothetical protein
MIKAERLLSYVQGSLVMVSGVVQVALTREHRSQIVEAPGGVGVVGAERPLPDVKGALEVVAGTDEIAFAKQQPAQVFQTPGGVGMVGASTRSRMARARTK